MIKAIEVVGPYVPPLTAGVTFKARIIDCRTMSDATGRNLMAILWHNEPDGSELLNEVTRRIASRVSPPG